MQGYRREQLHVKHLEELLDKSEVTPAVNQVEFNPFLYQEELLRFCDAKKIQLEAYSPLTRGHKLDHPVVLESPKGTPRAPPRS